MQILFLSHRLPYPPDKGERIRAFHELKYLAARHEVDLLCFADSKQDADQQSAIRHICRSVHVEVPSKPFTLLRAVQAGIRGRSMSSAFFYSSGFAETVRQLLRRWRYDVIFVYCSSMGQFIPWPAPAPVVVDFVDADSQKWRQYAHSSRVPASWLYAREARAVAASELELLNRAALSVVTTAHDKRELCHGAPGRSHVEVIANGVEVPELSTEEFDPAIRGLKPFALFVGTMSYKPNADATNYFARDILPRVRRRHPHLNFVIVGRNPDKQVRSLAALPGVIVTGAVNDVYKYFRKAEVSVAPFRISQGFHNKIAESLAVGTPVVTCERAAAGIGLSAQEGLFVANTTEQFVETIDFVLNSPSLQHELRSSAASTRKLLNWETRLQRLERMMQMIVNSNRSGRPELYQEACHE